MVEVSEEVALVPSHTFAGFDYASITVGAFDGLPAPATIAAVNMNVLVRDVRRYFASNELGRGCSRLGVWNPSRGERSLQLFGGGDPL